MKKIYLFFFGLLICFNIFAQCPTNSNQFKAGSDNQTSVFLYAKQTADWYYDNKEIWACFNNGITNSEIKIPLDGFNGAAFNFAEWPESILNATNPPWARRVNSAQYFSKSNILMIVVASGDRNFNFANTGPYEVWEFQLGGNPLPNSITRKQVINLGGIENTTMFYKYFLYTKLGGYIVFWGDHEGYGDYHFAYRSPVGIWQILPPVKFPTTPGWWFQNYSHIIQNIKDDSIWVFTAFDASGVIGAMRFTEQNNSLVLDFNNMIWIPTHNTGGDYLSPDGEYPDIIAVNDINKNRTLIAYARDYQVDYTGILGIGGQKYNYFNVVEVDDRNKPKLISTLKLISRNVALYRYPATFNLLVKNNKIWFSNNFLDEVIPGTLTVPDISKERLCSTFFIEGNQYYLNSGEWSIPKLMLDGENLGELLPNNGDVIKPTIVITLPANNQFISGKFDNQVLVSDNVGVVGVQYYLDNYPLKIERDGPFTLNWDTKDFESGIHYLYAVARDRNGNMATSSPVTINIASPIPPAITLPNNVEYADSMTTNQLWKYYYVDIPVNTNNVSINLIYSSALSGWTKLYVKYNRLFGWDFVIPRRQANSISCNITNPVNGKWLIAVQNPDLKNTSYKLKIDTGMTITNVPPPVPTNTPPPITNSPPVIDITPPVTTITFPLNGGVVARRANVNITANASDNNGVTKVEFYINGSLISTDISLLYSYIWKVPNAPRKTYTIQSKAYDAAGNVGHSSIVTVRTQ